MRKVAVIILFLWANSFAFAQDTLQKPQKIVLGSISNEKMQYLFQECSQIDYVFFQQDFSVSAEGNNAKSSLNHISVKPAEINPSAKPVARLYYLAEGNIALTAAVYFDEENKYFAFLENEKPFAANYMTDGGLAFFKQVVGAKIVTEPKQEGGH